MIGHPTAILVAGTGRHLDHLARLSAQSELPLDIRLCISHRPGVRALELARQHGIASLVVDPERKLGPEALSSEVFQALDEQGIETALLAGFLRFLPIPAAWQGRVLNVHPSLLPAFGGQGFYGDRVHQAVLDRGCKVSGCTVHYVDNVFDHGPILVQRVCPVWPDDTAHDLADRVFEQERIAYPDGIRLHLGMAGAQGLGGQLS
ncbi:MAG: phosphoribosylglycinamide formyltransferase [Planctomycetes bacterium]|nr:phosphoribosylglycinamide formyltransferase [Planctomycetota bacterium]MCB9909176.1 phosphoribosylglycinamide formyltransferase [Planctomycetota bacterium]HRV81670.1 formyltransferase family protein [Planctomycetota bacterium]